MLSKFIILAHRLFELNNFNGVMEILAGINSSPVRRLKKTWEVLLLFPSCSFLPFLLLPPLPFLLLPPLSFLLLPPLPFLLLAPLPFLLLPPLPFLLLPLLSFLLLPPLSFLLLPPLPFHVLLCLFNFPYSSFLPPLPFTRLFPPKYSPPNRTAVTLAVGNEVSSIEIEIPPFQCLSLAAASIFPVIYSLFFAIFYSRNSKPR